MANDCLLTLVGVTNTNEAHVGGLLSRLCFVS
jgi:hypothetical protein